MRYQEGVVLIANVGLRYLDFPEIPTGVTHYKDYAPKLTINRMIGEPISCKLPNALPQVLVKKGIPILRNPPSMRSSNANISMHGLLNSILIISNQPRWHRIQITQRLMHHKQHLFQSVILFPPLHSQHFDTDASAGSNVATSAVDPLHETGFDDANEGRGVGMLRAEFDFQLDGVDAVGTHVGAEWDVGIEGR